MPHDLDQKIIVCTGMEKEGFTDSHSPSLFGVQARPVIFRRTGGESRAPFLAPGDGPPDRVKLPESEDPIFPFQLTTPRFEPRWEWDFLVVNDRPPQFNTMWIRRAGTLFSGGRAKRL